MSQITIERRIPVPAARRRTEYVERKGIGHPDTMCDSMMEAASVALSSAYREACGRVLHHNLDKGLLVAGQSAPRPGGGKLLAPLRLILGDRATSEINGRPIPVGEIAIAAAKTWLSSHLRFVDPERHVVYQNEILPGSPELVDIFARVETTANDTSAGVGYAPLTETERFVLSAERYLNSPALKQRFPEVGEDIKVMAVRRDRRLSLTVAVAFVDRFISDASSYFERKEAVRSDLLSHLEPQLRELDTLEIAMNTLDSPDRGLAGIYLTVLGTSADGADGGQVGRGNRVNGLISLHRPMSTEAAAGKNPVSHVGKIYNVLAHHMAEQICQRVAGIEEATVWLCSQIGQPLAEPWSVAVEIAPLPGAAAADLDSAVSDVIAEELRQLSSLIERLVQGSIPVC
jgi:S-adenosylmethionine synthetase